VKYLRQTWSQSKIYRIILVIVVIYTVLRLLMQGVFLVGTLVPDQAEDSQDEQFVPVDLQIYLDAANHLRQREDLYLKGSLERLEDHYPYAPSFALAFIPFTWVSPQMTALIHTLLHIIAYVLLYIWWHKIFARLGLEKANRMMAWLLPVWLLFSAFWSDLGYLNIYIIMALFGTFFIDAVLQENLTWSVVWLSVILQIKPHWAFAAAVPLLLGRYRFFWKLISRTVLVYIIVVSVTILVMGPTYGWRQHVDYIRFLARLRRDFPWRGPEERFLGYNHSVTQFVAYLLGPSLDTLRLATLIKLLLLLPLAAVVLRYLRRPVNKAGCEAPQLGLDLAFVLYLGAFIWLDMVWELSLGIAVFTYLLATLQRRDARFLVWGVFLIYALVDFWQVFSFVAFGPDAVVPGPYVLTDPSIYVPLTMIVNLTFYALLVKRLWVVPMSLRVEKGG
jgi:hypothetical protein